MYIDCVLAERFRNDAPSTYSVPQSFSTPNPPPQPHPNHTKVSCPSRFLDAPSPGLSLAKSSGDLTSQGELTLESGQHAPPHRCYTNSTPQGLLFPGVIECWVDSKEEGLWNRGHPHSSVSTMSPGITRPATIDSLKYDISLLVQGRPKCARHPNKIGSCGIKVRVCMP